jgi:hypothetical protein
VSHTPGPWIKAPLGSVTGGEGGGIGIDATDRLDGMRFEVCEVWGIDDDRVHDARSHANAALIAAAPDLLEALKKVVALSDRKHDAWDAAHAAIAKAEGLQS